MLVVIHAYDEIFQGLHGIETFNILNVKNIEEAEDFGREESLDIINSYTDIMEQLEEDIFYNISEEESEDKIYYENLLREAIEEDIAFDIFKVNRNKESIEFLEQKFNEDPKLFIKEYCEIY